jgi:hypothetical protein
LLGTKWQTKSCKFKKFRKCLGSRENVPKVWGVKTVFSQGPDEKRLPEVGSQNCSIFATTLISFDVPVIAQGPDEKRLCAKHRHGLGVLKQLTPSRLN